MTFGLAGRDLVMMVSFAHATEIDLGRVLLLEIEEAFSFVWSFYCRLIRFSGIFVQNYSYSRWFLRDEV